MWKHSVYEFVERVSKAINILSSLSGFFAFLSLSFEMIYHSNVQVHTQLVINVKTCIGIIVNEKQE